MILASSAVTEGMLSALRDGAGQQVVRHLLGHLQGDVLLRLGRGGAEMRGDHDIVEPEQGAGGRRLLGEDVEGGAGDAAFLQRFGQRRLVDQAAAGAVDDAHRRLELGDVLLRQDVARLVGERDVKGDEIGPLEQLVEFDLGDAELRRALFRQERVVGDDLHFQTPGAVADDPADVAGADDAEGLAGEFDAHEAGFLPLAGVRALVGLGDLAGDGEHHGDGVLGGRDGVAEGRVHHDHAALGRLGDVDVVDPDPGPADHLKVLGGLREPSR